MGFNIFANIIAIIVGLMFISYFFANIEFNGLFRLVIMALFITSCSIKIYSYHDYCKKEEKKREKEKKLREYIKSIEKNGAEWEDTNIDNFISAECTICDKCSGHPYAGSRCYKCGCDHKAKCRIDKCRKCRSCGCERCLRYCSR